MSWPSDSRRPTAPQTATPTTAGKRSIASFVASGSWQPYEVRADAQLKSTPKQRTTRFTAAGTARMPAWRCRARETRAYTMHLPSHAPTPAHPTLMHAHLGTTHACARRHAAARPPSAAQPGPPHRAPLPSPPPPPLPLQVVLLDHGCYLTLAQRTRVLYCSLWACLFAGDRAGAAAAAIELGGQRAGQILPIILSQRARTK